MNVVRWLTDPANWSGSGGIPVRVLQHVEISLVAVVVAAAMAIPAGLVIGHTRRGEFLAVSVANLGRAIPSFAILIVGFQLILNFAPTLAFGFLPTVIAMVLLAIPPVLTNTYVGVQQVDPDTVEAARGVGMTEREVLMNLELPLAAPLIVAGLRTAAVQVVATATLAALIAGGGLGRFIVDGFAQQDNAQMISGAVLVALLAIITELVFALIGRATAPRLSSVARSDGPVSAEPGWGPSPSSTLGRDPEGLR